MQLDIGSTQKYELTLEFDLSGIYPSGHGMHNFPKFSVNELSLQEEHSIF